MNRHPEALAYIDSHREEFQKKFFELLRIESVSSDSRRKGDVERCARWVAAHLAAAGLQSEVIPTSGHPVVYAERVQGGRPVVLVYGHYDVQPPEPLEKWRHGPFNPVIEGGDVICRGASDDKGQCFSLLCGIEAAMRTGGARGVDVKILIEGEEEVGSPSLTPFIRSEKQRLKADCVVIADTSQFAPGYPAITYGLKGLVYLEAIVRGPKKDLHSGSYGGTVMNPANALCRMIAACQGPFGKVAIPGFYDAVRPLTESERTEFARLPFREEAFREEVGSPRLVGEEGFSTIERKWGRPTFDVNGLVSGFTGEGAKTVLPAEARCKFSMRLVPEQDPADIARKAESFLREITPPGVTLEMLSHHGAKPVLVPRESRAVTAAARALGRAFGREAVFIREGGSIPVVSTFKEELGIDSVLIGLGLPDDNAHSPNEKFRLEDFHRGMAVMSEFLEELGS